MRFLSVVRTPASTVEVCQLAGRSISSSIRATRPLETRRMDSSRPSPMICADLDRLREELRKLHESTRKANRAAQESSPLRPDTGMVVRGK